MTQSQLRDAAYREAHRCTRPAWWSYQTIGRKGQPTSTSRYCWLHLVQHGINGTLEEALENQTRFNRLREQVNEVRRRYNLVPLDGDVDLSSKGNDQMLDETDDDDDDGDNNAAHRLTGEAEAR